MDTTGNVVKEKSFLFAVRIVKAAKYLQQNHREFVLSKQLLRSGTSILKKRWPAKAERILSLKWPSLPKKQEKLTIGYVY